MDTRTETTNKKFREEMKLELGTKCYNCGSDECIEYHHIVPLFLGGTNKITNIVPLCHKCHQAAHRGRHLTKYTNKTHSGRKSKTDDEIAYEIFDMYKNGEIGTLKCKELLGYSRSTQIKDRLQFKRYLKVRGISEIRNNVDIVAVNTYSGLFEGVNVGHVVFENGEKKFIFYHETGVNNVVYEKRHKQTL